MKRNKNVSLLGFLTSILVGATLGTILGFCLFRAVEITLNAILN